MKRNQISNFVSTHMHSPFGLPGGFRGYHNTPKEPEFVPFNDESWSHDTVVDGDRLLDIEGNDITGQFDDKDVSELLEEEEDEEDDEEEESDEESDEEESEDEEEESDEEEEETEAKEDKSEAKEEKPAEEEEEVSSETVQLTSTFARLKRAEAIFKTAAKEAEGEVTAEAVAKPLVEKRNALLRERSKIDPLSGDDAADRLAEIDIEVSTLNTTISARINQAELTRRDSVSEAKQAASSTVEEAISLIGKVYPQLNESSKLYRSDLADTFNALQEQYQRSMSVTDAMQKALETVVKMSGIKAKGTSTEKPVSKTQKEAVKQRLAAKDKLPVRKGKASKSGEDASLRSLLTKDMSDPKVRSALQKMTGMTFDE